MSAVSILAVTAAGMIVTGCIWVWLVLSLTDQRAGASAAASMMSLPGIALVVLGAGFAIVNGIVAVLS